MRARGFTLLEVLVALSIFTLIGLGANHVLKTVIDTKETTESYSTRFGELQRALGVITRDLEQLNDRGIRDELGDPRPPLVVGEEPYLLEFTRTGWRNPAHAKRSNLERVAYSLTDGVLSRHYWLVLDRAEDSVPVTQKLLSGVEEFSINVITQKGDVTFTWPDESTGSAKGGALPDRLELVLGVKDAGEIRSLIDLVAVPSVTQNRGGAGGGEQFEGGPG